MGSRGSNFKRNISLAIFICLVGVLGLSFRQYFRASDKKLHLVFCDVGQGDATYLRAPDGQEVLIDGGPNDKVLDCLSSYRPFYDRKIEMIVLTHPQADHLTGLISVLKRYKVDYLVTENIANDTAVFERFRQAVAEENLRIYNPQAGDKIRLGETELDFIWPQKVIGDQKLWSGDLTDAQVLDSSTFGGDLNDYSLVFNIRYKDFVVLQTGDAESPTLERAITGPYSAAVLKVPHHGSKKALSGQILEFLRPKLAVISVGRDNRFGHPAEETLEKLRDFGIKTLRTDEQQNIEVTYDGEKWIVK